MTYMIKLDEDDRRLLATTVERLASDQFSLDRCRAAELICAPEEWTAFAEVGLFGIGVDPLYGGIGGGVAEHAMVMREIGYNLLPLPYMDTMVLCAPVIEMLGSQEQKSRLLPSLAGGELRLAFAHREADAGDEIAHVATKAYSDRLTGQKMQVMGAYGAQKFVVSAIDENGSIRFFLVDKDQPGLDIQFYRLMDNRQVGRVILTDVPGEPLGGDGSKVLSQLYDRACVCIAAETAGIMAALNRDTLEYAKVRKQFGKPIGAFQVLQHRLVDMYIGEQTAAAMVADVVDALEVGRADADILVSAAKTVTDRSARQAAEAAIQIHGGMGLTDECSAGHYLKRILTNGSQFSTAGWHVARITRSIV